MIGIVNGRYGHESQFPPPTVSGRCKDSKAVPLLAIIQDTQALGVKLQTRKVAARDSAAAVSAKASQDAFADSRSFRRIIE
jgi:hypothetical protein